MLERIRSNVFQFISSFYYLSLFSTYKAQPYRVIGLILLGLISRLLPHPPNCTAINAIALFGICSLGSLGISLFTVFSSMLLYDLFFGFHSSIGFVYLSLGLITIMGYRLKSKRSLIQTVFLLTFASILFFIMTNFGIWLAGPMYPKTLSGLGLCFFNAIPFFAYNLMGTLFYGGALFAWLTISSRLPALLIRNRLFCGFTRLFMRIS